MIEVVRKTEYFLDIPVENSTTGSNPCRGFYTFIGFSNREGIWINSKGNEISDSRWVKKLNDHKNLL